jgi:hypothetical protein
MKVSIFLRKAKKATWSMELFGNFPTKISHSRKEIMKLPRFEEDLGKFIARIFFFFWNHHILANRFKGSPTCNKFPRFFYSSILVVARFG